MVLLGSRATVKTSSTTLFVCTTLGAPRQPTTHRTCPPAPAGRRGDRVADTPPPAPQHQPAPPHHLVHQRLVHGGPHLAVASRPRRPFAPPPLPGRLRPTLFDAYPRADCTPTREAVARLAASPPPRNGGT